MGGAVFNLSGAFTAVGSTLAGNTADDDGASIYNLVYDAATARTRADDAARHDRRRRHRAVGSRLEQDRPSPAAAWAARTRSSASATSSRAMAARETGSIIGSPLTADPKLGPLQ